MPYLLLRFGIVAFVCALGFASARAEVLQGPIGILVCKNGVSTGDFKDLRFPLGQMQLILSKKVYCAQGPHAQPDEVSWTAIFKPAGTATETGGDEATFNLAWTTQEQIFIHAETLSIVAIRRGQEPSTKEVVRIGIESGRFLVKSIDASPLADDHAAEEIPYWGADSSARPSRSLSPLLGDVLPLRLVDSPWLEIADGLLLDMRSGATRPHKTERSAGLYQMRMLGLGPDDRTLLSLACTEGLLGLRLVLTDTIEDSVQIIPFDAPELGVPRVWSGSPDTSAITAAWILRRFEVIALPGKALELHPRPVRPAAPRPSFVSDNDITIGLVCVRSTIIPLIIQALRRDWTADFRENPVLRDRDAHTGVTCLRDKSGLISVVEKIWYGTVGRADIALTFFEDGRVSLTFLGTETITRRISPPPRTPWHGPPSRRSGNISMTSFASPSGKRN
jgi:hypothetical protein